ncbi:MAG TPA: cupredoxin domain-containing protein [Gaiellaceae bacterium]|nr:cupredoxin domain-containing protein [Gaiellaceae bacterium]
MRTVVFAAAAVLALAVTGASQPASQATKAVAIKATGFSPASVTIATTDAVKWTNRDTKNHQIVANNGSFASAVIKPGKSYTHTFSTAGTFRYHDALHPTLAGKVVVKGPPPAVTIATLAPIIDYGQTTHISGTVSSGKAGETVTVWAQPYGTVSPVQIATLLTATNGIWDLVVKPTLLTTYTAHWKSTVSQAVGVQLRPSIAFSAYKRYGSVKVKTDRSLKGQKVYLQKFTRFHEWVKVRPVILGNGSARHFKLGLSGGHRYAVRIFMSFNQVGAGYLDGFSRTVVVRAPRR